MHDHYFRKNLLANLQEPAIHKRKNIPLNVSLLRKQLLSEHVLSVFVKMLKGVAKMLVAHYQTVSQFESGESVNECGPFAVAMNRYAGKDAPGGSPEDVDQLADNLWQQFGGGQGIGMQQLFDMLHTAGVRYQTVGSDELNLHVDQLTPAVALQWLRQGYPLICTVNESNVIDLDLGRSPYPWLAEEPYHSNPPNHIFTLAGIADDGNVLVADPANAGSFPRRYQLDRLNFITLVAVILPSMSEIPGEVMSTITIDLTDPIVARYFTQTPDGQWQCKQTGFIVRKGILTFYRSFAQDAYCGLTYLGLPLSNEESVAGHSSVVKQRFERAMLAYDPNHELDQPPGASEVYLLHNP